MRKASEQKPSMLVKWFIRAPVRALCRFRDVYIRGMTSCAGRVHAGGVAFGHPSLSNRIRRSNSLGSDTTMRVRDEEELVHLVRARELRRAPRSVGFGHELSRSSRRSTKAIERIDEDRACEFDEDVEARSRNFAIGSKRRAARVHA